MAAAAKKVGLGFARAFEIHVRFVGLCKRPAVIASVLTFAAVSVTLAAEMEVAKKPGWVEQFRCPVWFSPSEVIAV